MPIEDDLKINRPRDLRTGVVSAKVRWLAVLAGSACKAFGVANVGPLFLIFGAFLILGAIVQPRALTSGRWLMWVGALWLSLTIAPYGFRIVLEDKKMLRSIHDGWMIVMFSLAVVATASVLCCDAVLVMEGLKSRRNEWVRGSLDWVVWISAVVLSAWCAWMVRGAAYAYLHHGRLDILLTWAGLDALILFFDIALMVHAVKSRRTE